MVKVSNAALAVIKRFAPTVPSRIDTIMKNKLLNKNVKNIVKIEANEVGITIYEIRSYYSLCIKKVNYINYANSNCFKIVSSKCPFKAQQQIAKKIKLKTNKIETNWYLTLTADLSLMTTMVIKYISKIHKYIVINNIIENGNVNSNDNYNNKINDQ